MAKRPFRIAFDAEELHVLRRALMLDADHWGGHAWNSDAEQLRNRVDAVMQRLESAPTDHLRGRVDQEIDNLRRASRERQRRQYEELQSAIRDGYRQVWLSGREGPVHLEMQPIELTGE